MTPPCLAHGVERRRPPAVPDEIGVAIVLEDRHAVLRGEAQQLMPACFAHDRAGRILHGRNGVDVFRPHAAALEVVERGCERVDAHALGVERDADGRNAKPRQTCQCALIRRLLDDDGIAAIEENAVDEIDRLQRAGGDEDFVGIARDAGGALELLREEVAQRTVAERAAGKPVGREVPAFAREHVGRRLQQLIDRNMIGVVVAAGEIVLGEARPLGGRRRQPGCQQWREIE